MKLIILGGGLTGLSCAYKLEQSGKDYVLIEKDTELGGLCKSVVKNNFIFDYTGHFLHFQNSEIEKFVKTLLKNNLLEIIRNSKIYTQYARTKNYLIPYPFQANLKFLKQNILQECIKKLLKAQLNTTNLSTKDFYNWTITNFGSGIAKYFFLPYNTKLWQYSLRNIPISWAKRFIPVPNVEEILNNIVFGTEKSYGYNTKFFYPKLGGIQSLISAITQNLDQRKIIKTVSPVELNYKLKKIKLSNGEILNYTYLISTIPLPELIKISNLPEKIKQLRKKLTYTGVICFNIALKRTTMKNVHWIYFPDKEFIFYRVGFYHNINSFLVPGNYGALYVEVSYRGEQKFSIKTIFEKVVSGLISSKVITSPEDILFYDTLYIPVAYVVYQKDTEKIVSEIQNFLSTNNIFSVGRYGGWKYSYMEENIKDGFDTAKHVVKRNS